MRAERLNSHEFFVFVKLGEQFVNAVYGNILGKLAVHGRFYSAVYGEKMGYKGNLYVYARKLGKGLLPAPVTPDLESMTMPSRDMIPALMAGASAREMLVG